MPTTQGRRPSLIDDRWRAISTTMPLPVPPPRLNTTTTMGVDSLASTLAAKASSSLAISPPW